MNKPTPEHQGFQHKTGDQDGVGNMYNIGHLTTVRGFDAANELLEDGWILLHIDGSPGGELSKQLITLGLMRKRKPEMV